MQALNCRPLRLQGTCRPVCSTHCGRTYFTVQRVPLHVLVRSSVQPDVTDSQQPHPQDDFEGLLPEEDYEIPGNYMDAMSNSTKLGKAVRAAVEELEHLGDLETDVLQQCDDLLKKLGMKGSIFGSSPPPSQSQASTDSSSPGQ